VSLKRPTDRLAELIEHNFGFPWERLFDGGGRGSQSELTRARNIAFYLMHYTFGLSYAEIGAWFELHWSSVKSAILITGKRRAESVALDTLIDQIDDELQKFSAIDDGAELE
jgi:hypothetical protein